ncbi:MAG: hypothetical protein ACI95C_002385 [Pseudohongiellaceae bacterium]
MTSSPSVYPVSLNGLHTLSFIIFDGGGEAGGMYRLETNTNTVFLDSDEDGLTDPEELLYGTDKNNSDTDGDSVNDGDEVDAGTDPTVPDVFVVDSDGDGVDNTHDLCPATPAGSIIGATGCSGAQGVALVCPADGPDAVYKNHGAYVSCVAKAVNSAIAIGLLTETDGGAIVSVAGQSSVAKPASAGKKK